ncbi:MAG: hypothetical protein H6867_10645 [Rhodospirillales bacterium]|nr:hypothetical protein [Rhodospirillales bacterium]MCB9995759.1 hypothetical protein [Rhodospirillales bacterium]
MTGLASRHEKPDAAEPVLLTGAATDPQTGLIVSLASSSKFNENGQLDDLKIKYWRQLPYGESRNQNLITIKAKPVGKHITELSELWVQSSCVYDSRYDDANNPEVRKKINRVLEGVNRLNTHLRDKGPVEDTAKILNDCYFDQVIGEKMIVRGLKKDGGFEFSLSPYFTRNAAQGVGVEFRDVDLNRLKSVMGFSINTLEPDKDFSDDREVFTTDPQSGINYVAGVRLKEYKTGRVVMDIYDNSRDVPGDVDASEIDQVMRFEWKRNRQNGYTLTDLHCLGNKVDITDMNKVLRCIGFAQSCNDDLAKRKYPAFMDYLAEYDMLDAVSPLPPPPPLKDGGEMQYVSLHGTGMEKTIENYGDQIGIADVFLHRGTKEDGSLSSAGIAMDFPFASGGANSNFDGAVPDYMWAWNDLKAFFITHGHFDHCDGLAYYAKAGLMKEKDVYATAEVKYFLDKKMDFLKVPRSMRPKITVVDDETPVAIKDDDGVTRFWVQPCPNGASHSANCTPYIVTGCYGDQHYNGAATVYGDANKLTQKGEAFYQKGIEPLKDMQGVTPEKIDALIAKQGGKHLLAAYHDPTAITYEGHAPEEDEVENTLTEILGFFPDKGVLMAPISTNDVEYVVGSHVAHNTGRDITAVGRNAELRISCRNLFGMRHDLDLRDVRIDPFEELKNPTGLIPKDVLDTYFAALENVEINDSNVKVNQDDIDAILNEMDYDPTDKKEAERAERKATQQAWENAYEIYQQKKIEAARTNALKSYKEKLDPIEREHEKNTKLFMLKSLMKHDAVVFENDYNDYLMWKAIMDQKETASIRATRNSKLAKDFRLDPGRLMVFITGTQGNAEERFSTLQKLIDFFSLLDADESVRSTGYSVDLENFVAVISQPAIVGNEDSQRRMIDELVRKRNITVACAFMNGYTIFNPKEKRDKILNELQKKGLKYEPDAAGNIHVYNRAAHYHGHGFKENVRSMIQNVDAKFHVPHHIPSYDANTAFEKLCDEEQVICPRVKPKDFQVMRLDAHKKTGEEQYKKITELNPSYVLIRLARKYGQYFGGWMQLTRATMLRREGAHRADGLMARTTKDGFYEQNTAQQEWERVSNPQYFQPLQRTRKIGPSMIDRGEGRTRHRSRPVWYGTKPPGKDAA